VGEVRGVGSFRLSLVAPFGPTGIGWGASNVCPETATFSGSAGVVVQETGCKDGPAVASAILGPAAEEVEAMAIGLPRETPGESLVDGGVWPNAGPETAMAEEDGACPGGAAGLGAAQSGDDRSAALMGEAMGAMVRGGAACHSISSAQPAAAVNKPRDRLQVYFHTLCMAKISLDLGCSIMEDNTADTPDGGTACAARE
jgi:hypothetical protein